MNISKAIVRQEALGDQSVGSVQKSPFSPVLRFLEGKAAAIFARGAYWHYVSTEQWRERRWRLFSTDPLRISERHPKKDLLSIHREGNLFLGGDLRRILLSTH